MNFRQILMMAANHGGGGAAAAAVPTTLPTVSASPSWAYGSSTLVSGYSGALFQLIRASDSTTLDISAGANGVADISGVAAFGSGTTLRVTTWYDQTGNGNHAVQATAASQPMFLASNAIRSKYPIDCGIVAANGNHDQSRFLSRPSLSIDRQAATAFSVAGVAGGPTNSYGIMSLGTSATLTANVQLIYDTTSSWSPLYVLDNAFQSGALSSIRTPSAGQPSIATLCLGASNRKYRVNGTQIFSFAALSAGTMTGGYIGKGAWTSATLGPAHHLADVGYAAALSDADMALVEAALATIFDVLTSTTKVVIFDGDSIPNGETNGLYGQNFPFLALPSLNSRVYSPNYAIAGQTAASIYSRRATTLAAAINGRAGDTKKIIAVLMGTNDIANAASGSIVGVGATTWTNSILPYIQYWQGQGYSVVVGTIIPRNWLGSGTDISQRETERTSLNSTITSSAVANSYTVADYASIAGLSNPLGANYSDGVHPNAAGAALMAPVAAAAINVYL